MLEWDFVARGHVILYFQWFHKTKNHSIILSKLWFVASSNRGIWKKNLEELLLSIRTIYSFGNVSAVKEGCPGGSGSNGSLAVHASPLSASPWHAFGAGACEVGWLVSSAGWMKSCSACAAAHQGGTFVLWNCMHGLNAVGCQCKSRESVWVISPEQEL